MKNGQYILNFEGVYKEKRYYLLKEAQLYEYYSFEILLVKFFFQTKENSISNGFRSDINSIMKNKDFVVKFVVKELNKNSFYFLCDNDNSS